LCYHFERRIVPSFIPTVRKALIMLRHAASLLLLALCVPSFAAEPLVLDVWPGRAPGETKAIGPEAFRPPRGNEKPNVQRLGNVSHPTLTIFQSPEEKRNGCCIVVCPGGGYSILAWDLEGTEVAQWLNALGVTAAVLKYRVPKREDDDPNNQRPLMDGQRSISLLRSKASELKIDPQRIGMLGFSAGGHLTAATCIQHAKRKYDAVDAADEVSCRPNFGVLVYAGGLLDESDQLKPEFQPTSQSPPMFFAHALDDRVKPQNSIQLLLALKTAGVRAELHLYDAGGHGFGLRKSEFPCHTWPERCGEWMAHHGWLARAE
jgi:acetyl esterase/lipase